MFALSNCSENSGVLKIIIIILHVEGQANYYGFVEQCYKSELTLTVFNNR
jgi:hypothetical protein